MQTPATHTLAVHHTCGDPRCTDPTHLDLEFADESREIIVSLHAESEHYRSLTDRGIDPHTPAGPDLDDLDADQVDADMLGLTQCANCDWNFPDDEIRYGCTDVDRYCLDCHEQYCTDRSCREFDCEPDR